MKGDGNNCFRLLNKLLMMVLIINLYGKEQRLRDG